LLTVLRARGMGVTEEHEQRILACADIEVLDEWLRRAATVASTEQLFD